MSGRFSYVVDCEWNSPTRELLSMAIVPLWPSVAGERTGPVDDPTHEFYETIQHSGESIDPFVQEQVLPVLGKVQIPRREFQGKLEAFLRDRHVSRLLFDWPEDIAYFCNALITGPGTRLLLPRHLQMENVTGLDSYSEVPHNALHDARGMAYLLRKHFRRMAAH